jgi:hypothetical protein
VSDFTDIETFIAAAQKHGEDSEPDHEVGDLQDMLRAAWSIMTPEQRRTFATTEEVDNVMDSAYGDGDEEDDENGAAPTPK